MKAITYSEYGPPDVFRLQDVERPVPRKDEILVQVQVTSVTAADWRMRKADPFLARLFNGLLRPRRVKILGYEFAGVVAEIGAQVSSFAAGDRVFGHNGFRFGAYAEFVRVRADGMVVPIPDGLAYTAAAALPFGGLAALNHLRLGSIRPGQQVLIYGASGCGGTYAVQLAKHFGAAVTGVCSRANAELVRSLGADRTIDYRSENIFERGERYDLIYDAVGKMISRIPPAQFKRLLVPGGSFVSVETSRKDRPEDLKLLGEWAAAGIIEPVIDRSYPLARIAEAHAYVEGLHKKGNVVITVLSES